MKEVQIANRPIGLNHPPFIIAEMSGNHNQSLDRALEIVEAAAKSGVHALKLQTYTADTITLNSTQAEFFINDADSLWKGQTLHQLYQQAYTPWEWHKPIFDRCKQLGLIAFSSPFDETAVDFLESLDVPCYKIASFENNDLPLIKKVAQTGKPVIISTGMASLSDLDELVKTFRQAGGTQLILLKCTSSYPASPLGTNLRTIPVLRELFNSEVGLSDHTLGIGVSVASVAFGATVIEKHFTLARADGGVDSVFSMEPQEMKLLVSETQQAFEALGHVSFGATAQEQKSLKFRRSIYVSQNIRKGEALTPDNIRIVRPGYGLPPKQWEFVLGKIAICDLKIGDALQMSHLIEESH